MVRRNSKYKYDINDIIERKNHNLKILNKTRIKNGKNATQKAYSVECLHCGKIFDISETGITKGVGCSFCNSLGYKKEYKYNIGDLFEYKNGDKVEILNKFYINKIDAENKKIKKQHFGKVYKTKCLKCGYISYDNEMYLERKFGCPVCNNKKVVKGINDVATTHKEYLKYFLNKEDAYTITYSSNKKIQFICPLCKTIKTSTMNKISNRGFSCSNPNCNFNNGYSYPNRFMYSFLKQLKVNFESEKIFNWSKNKKYDFYIPSLSCIIEAMGKQHYEDWTFSRAEEQQKNDKLKEQLAKENGIKHYIVLDCRKSETEWIKNSILNSELNELFDLSNINWQECELNSRKSLILEIYKKYNEENFENLKEFSKNFPYPYEKIISIISEGDKNGIINNKNKFKIYILYKGERYEFDRISHCIKFLKENFNISICHNKIKELLEYNSKNKNKKEYKDVLIDYR